MALTSGDLVLGERVRYSVNVHAVLQILCEPITGYRMLAAARPLPPCRHVPDTSWPTKRQHQLKTPCWRCRLVTLSSALVSYHQRVFPSPELTTNLHCRDIQTATSGEPVVGLELARTSTALWSKGKKRFGQKRTLVRRGCAGDRRLRAPRQQGCFIWCPSSENIVTM
eukprot:1196195-Prorocentrum_minimum.AAC.3